PGLAGAAYIGVFEMGLAFVTWLTALKCAENASRVANLIFLSPFCSLILIHFLVGEAILPSTVVGLGLILAGLGVQRVGG
ncbi:MAG: EamA family transporter, partial [Acidobacteriota bacterium]